MANRIKIDVKRGDIAAIRTPAVVVNLYRGADRLEGTTKAVDTANGGAIGRAIGAGDFSGKLGETLVLYPEGGPAERIVLIGLGSKDEFDYSAATKTGAAMGRVLQRLGVKSAHTGLHGGDSGSAAELSRGLAEGLVASLYRYHKYFRDGRAETLALNSVTVVESNAAKMRVITRGVGVGTDLGDSMGVTRDLVNGPGNDVTPTKIADTAKSLGRKLGFKVTIMDRDECERLGMGAFLAVAQGSEEPCKFIVMEYRGGSRGTICFVGKGITFDTGGISLKPGAEMDLMKYDMGGSGAVMGAMNFAATQKVPMDVIGIIAATENMPSGKAYKPGDVITASNGVTIDVKNTDAEGRVILSDALVYAERFNPDAVIDLATLTGACMIALGPAIAAMGNDEWLLDGVVGAGDASGERVWPMPLWEEYREKIKSDVADIKNSAGREAGALTAGAFLGAFTDNYRWVHLDIAGAAWNSAPSATMGTGSTAAGVRTLCQFLLDWRRPKGKGNGPSPGPRTSVRGVTPVDEAGDPVKPVRSAGSAPTATKGAKKKTAKKTTKKKTVKKKATRKKTSRRKKTSGR